VLANLIVAELALGFYHWYKTGTLLWIHATSLPSTNKGAAPPIEEDPVKTKMVLDPYFGDNTLTGVHFRGLFTDQFYMERITGTDYLPSYYDRLKVNNHGFWGLYDYPYRAKDDEFVIGVFGGSLAFHFWLSTLDERSPVLKRFAAATGKRVIFLNFASGGRKQPQTMLQLAYFMAIGQHFDFVLNVDGFNEIYDAWLNLANYKISYTMPFAEFAFKIQNAFLERVFFGADRRIADLVDRRDRWAARANTSRSAIFFYVTDLLRENYASQLNTLEAQLAGARNDLRYPVQLVPSDTDNYDELIPKIAQLWFNGSVAMHRLAAPAGIPYLHVLQPNQYASRKHLSAQEEEWKVRGVTHVPLQRIVPQGYRAFLQLAPSFTEQNIAFVDATPVYDETSETVFIDWCCHVNDAGNSILSARIEPRMIDMLHRHAGAMQ
jgi:hypothetical protein